MTALPLPQAGTAHHEEVSSESAVVPVGKESPGWHPFSPYSVMDCFVGAPILVLPYGDCRETFGTQPLGIWLWQKRGGSAYNKDHLTLAHHFLMCRVQNSHNQQLCTSAEQSQWYDLTRELSKGRYAWFESSNEEFCWSWRLVCLHLGQRAES